MFVCGKRALKRRNLFGCIFSPLYFVLRFLFTLQQVRFIIVPISISNISTYFNSEKILGEANKRASFEGSRPRNPVAKCYNSSEGRLASVAKLGLLHFHIQ